MNLPASNPPERQILVFFGGDRSPFLYGIFIVHFSHQM